jgi:metallopeptidase MepB
MIQPPPRFTATPESIAEDAQRLVEHSRRSRDELVRSVAPSAATFANVMLPLAHMENDFALQANILGFYRHVSGDHQIRDASAKARTLLDDFLNESFMREDIFILVGAVRRNGQDIDQESSLFLKRMYDQHVQKGAGIRDAAQKQRFKVIEARLNHLNVKFEENLGLNNSSICFSRAELEGVPQHILSEIERNERDEFQVILSNLRYIAEIMSQAKNAKTRKRLFIAHENRCSENAPLLKEAVILRLERARLLGFSNNATFRLKDKMVKTLDGVNEFLADLQSKLTPGGLDLVKTLKDLKKVDLPQMESVQNDDQFFLWDYDFYYNLMLDRQVLYDRNRIKEYFPMQTTIAGMLKLLAQIFELAFTELEDHDKPADIVWHQDVRVLVVHDDQKRGGSFLGYLYLDLFHRPDKYPGAACFSLQPVSTLLLSIVFRSLT